MTTQATSLKKDFFTDDKAESLGTSFLPTRCSSSDSQEKPELKLLLGPSLMAGALMGATNFAQGTIAEIGLGASYLYAGGALLSSILYFIYGAIQQRRQSGEWWRAEDSNLWKRQGGRIKVLKRDEKAE